MITVKNATDSHTYGCEPHSDGAFAALHTIASRHRDSYIATALGRLPEDPPQERKNIFVLDSGDDLDELKNRQLKDVASWFEAAKDDAVSGPNVYIYCDYMGDT